MIGKQAALNRMVLIICLSAALSGAASRAYASELYEAVVEILKEDAIDIDMTYCPKISYRGADSVYAVVSSPKNKIWLAGIEYPEGSKVRAFLFADTNSTENGTGNFRELSCKGSTIKFEREGAGKTLWVTEYFQWNGEHLTHTETHRAANTENI